MGCKGINVKKAILLYPEWEGDCLKKDTINVKNSDIEIRKMTINLAGDKQTFDKNCLHLVKEIMDFAGISMEPSFNCFFAPAPPQSS
jgi:hypothetical protein